MSAPAHIEQVEVDSREALWAWLAANHAQSESIWLVTFKKHTGAKYLSTGDVFDALIAHGWIDGRRKVLDADRTMQFIAPRQTQAWAKSYKDRAAKLEAEGRMHPAGRAKIEKGKASGLWSFYDDIDALIAPDDLIKALGRTPLAKNHYEDYPPAYKRNLLRWIKLAKTDATRKKRIVEIAQTSTRNACIPQM